MKDDHDYRYDDADTTGNRKPSHSLGKAIFIEQVPLGHQGETPLTYRTSRLNKHLQSWFLEGRDYRSPNNKADNQEKTIWGTKQEKWLKKTLLESDALFKIIVTPTPMVGPDDKRKTDNHTNIGGFRTERKMFFDWLTDNGFLEKNLYFVCGDRHWQYHAKHPSGYEEFSSGAQVDENSRLGRKAGDPNSTDPGGLIKQFYLQEPASGGFLKLVQEKKEGMPVLQFLFFNEKGDTLYWHVKTPIM